MSARRYAPRTRPKGLDRSQMLQLLPSVGITADPGVRFPCVLPGHRGHDAVVDGRTFAYRCLAACSQHS